VKFIYCHRQEKKIALLKIDEKSDPIKAWVERCLFECQFVIMLSRKIKLVCAFVHLDLLNTKNLVIARNFSYECLKRKLQQTKVSRL